MPKKPKTNKKNYRKRKGYKNYRRKKGYPLKVPKSLDAHFPPALRTKLKMVTDFKVTGTVSTADGCASYFTFHGNNPGTVGPSIEASQNAAWGAYGVNFPAGLIYLMGTQSGSGVAAGIYQSCLVLGSSIRIGIATDTATVNPSPIFMTVFPIADEQTGYKINYPVSNLAEQMYAKHILVPQNEAEQMILKNSCSTKKVFGFTRDIATNDDQLVCTMATGVLGAPQYPWNWTVGMRNADNGSTAWTLALDVEIVYDCIFYDRNIFSSQAPT